MHRFRMWPRGLVSMGGKRPREMQCMRVCGLGFWGPSVLGIGVEAARGAHHRWVVG